MYISTAAPTANIYDTKVNINNPVIPLIIGKSFKNKKLVIIQLAIHNDIQ